ncbi:hypothetical protein L6R52_36760 [Myxococcota bacterium]|nr:hypothetical protein [Myxococcota bacterium]
MLSILGAVLIAATLVVAGCGTDQNNNEELGAQISAILGNDFTGNYVRIHGVRNVPADTKYPCLNEFDVCLGMSPEGMTSMVRDLCPSDDTPEGVWTFTYVIYADAACVEPLANLGCIPTMDEWLHPGYNHNDVVCITRNADKGFDFCVLDPVTWAGSEACPPCIPNPGSTGPNVAPTSSVCSGS